MFVNVVCQICTDLYDAERDVAAMPCGHTFHDNCLDRWLQTTRNCPSCRKPLKKNQNPVHRLYFTVDSNCSQAPGTSPKSKDPLLLEKNRKLQAQVAALQAAITKLKSECQQFEDEKIALSCALSDKNTEMQGMSRIQDKLKRKIREFTGRQSELEEVKAQLYHLRHVQTIVEGVETEVKHMLEEKVGYTSQQLTYVILLRQQLDGSKRTNEKLRREITESREKLLSFQRQCKNGDSEIELLKLELKQAETRSITLKRKCDMLITSMNSPSGISSSLAKRIVHQSPAPQLVTPPPFSQSTASHSWGMSNIDASVLSSQEIAKSGLDDEIKMFLNFNDDAEETVPKRPRFLGSKDMLTQDKRGVGDESPASSGCTVSIKPKTTIKIMKAKHRIRPVNPSVDSASQMKDISNTANPNSFSSKSSNASKQTSQYFRQGFDGMGGQVQLFSRTQSAMQFNVFKKPAAVKSKPRTAPPPRQTTLDEIILLD